MASVQQCRAALDRLAAHLAQDSRAARRRVEIDRTIRCRITDLDTVFHGRLHAGQLTGIAEGDHPDAQITLAATSDDLIAMVDGTLDLTKALATGRMSIKASPFDLLKLRKLR